MFAEKPTTRYILRWYLVIIAVPLLLIANAVFMAVSGIDEVFLNNSSSSHHWMIVVVLEVPTAPEALRTNATNLLMAAWVKK